LDPVAGPLRSVYRRRKVIHSPIDLRHHHHHHSSIRSTHTNMAADLQAIAGQLQASLDPQQSRQGECSLDTMRQSSAQTLTFHSRTDAQGPRDQPRLLPHTPPDRKHRQLPSGDKASRCSLLQEFYSQELGGKCMADAQWRGR
jgi:hypothetical protein